MLIKNSKDVYSLIYKFTRDPNICLIGITNNYDTPTLVTDARGPSSFHPVGVVSAVASCFVRKKTLSLACLF